MVASSTSARVPVSRPSTNRGTSSRGPGRIGRQPVFAELFWKSEDVTDEFEVTEKQANKFLLEIESEILRASTEAGYAKLRELAEQRGFKKL